MVTPYLDDGDFRLYHGDARVVLPDLPASSVHAVLTSPPFFGLRDYGTGNWEGGDAGCDHVGSVLRTAPPGSDKQASNTGANAIASGPCKCGAIRVDRQIGLEDDPDAYVENLRGVFAEVARILRPDGTLWVEIGDGFASKNLAGTPWRLAFALQRDGWIWRNVVIWHKPNPMPESVRDRFTASHSYVLLFSKQPRYFFDAEAVREDNFGDGRKRGGREPRPGIDRNGGNQASLSGIQNDGAGRNARSVWTIPTEPLREEHYAAFPQQLAERVIRAATSELGCCETCGAPWRRVSQRLHETGSDEDRRHAVRRLQAAGGAIDGGTEHSSLGAGAWGYRTVGWRPTCSCGGGIAPCWVLDPFIGSGTTALVARRLGRCCVGVELSSDYCELVARRTPQLTLALGVNE